MSASPQPSDGDRTAGPGDGAPGPDESAPAYDDAASRDGAAHGSSAVGGLTTDGLTTDGPDRPTERPSRRLSEERSAAILMGDQGGSPYQSDPYTTITPGDDAAPAPRAGADDDRSPEARARAAAREDDPDTDVILDGATEARPRSRTAAHFWSILLTLVLLPVAWYLLADAGARLTLPEGNPWDTGTLNVAALLELAAGLVVLVVVLLTARWSSVGAFVSGVLVLLLGLAFVAVPEQTADVVETVSGRLDGLGDLGSNVTHHLVATGSTGRFVVYGVALILLGVVSHGARRQGRREAALPARSRRG
ncbi:hypothetical protein [Georgenia faecalis]|uniref:Trp biosynthesis-associated membrane protein n=1 Tax=Georgenia faecalis TaxID=2483799 RepID=A0ABV9D710_9MICO|nr:hypothetical protein [Georgenia faecalis]